MVQRHFVAYWRYPSWGIILLILSVETALIGRTNCEIIAPLCFASSAYAFGRRRTGSQSHSFLFKLSI